MIVASLDLITFLTDVSILWVEFAGQLSCLVDFPIPSQLEREWDLLSTSPPFTDDYS
jgi:hypothetical protein